MRDELVNAEVFETLVDTKFCPWDDHSYAVFDFPEAVFSNLGLTYLAHTHVPTIWRKQGVELPQLEWQKLDDGSYVMHRRLPNGIWFGTEVTPKADHLQMNMWLTNGTDKPLSGLRVQNCVILKAADGFTQQSNDNKMFERGYAAAHPKGGERWMEGLNAGHSFVTTGPLMNLRFNGALPGTTWQHAGTDTTVTVCGTIDSRHPLRTVEIISNGSVLQRLSVTPNRTSSETYQYQVRTDVAVTGSGWPGVRCVKDLPGDKISFAHTNPAFVDVAGHPLKPRRRDAEFFISRMDKELARNQGVLSKEALAEYAQAREVYQGFLARAQD